MIYNIDEPVFRLVGGCASGEGRLEIYKNHMWSPLNSALWCESDVNVTCAHFGFR